MRHFTFWLVLLIGVVIVVPYARGVRPKSRRDWVLIAILLAFLLWLLPGLDSPLRSR